MFDLRMQFPGLSAPARLLTMAALLTPLLLGAPVFAHHVADLGTLQPTVVNGVLSGLAHPVLGPDHLLFLLALSLVGLQRRLSWALGLLLVGLIGSVAGLLWSGLPGAEALVAGTLVVEALVLLRRLPAMLLLPAMALHGYVLSGPVFGWSSMPVAAYGAGLLISQGMLLTLALVLLRPLANRLSPHMLRWVALALAACGATWALAAVAG
jgi:urease accessory protein